MADLTVQQKMEIFLDDYLAFKDSLAGKSQENEENNVNNVDVLGDRLALSQGKSVRIKNAMLIYPHLRASDIDEEDDDARQYTVIAVPKDKEVLTEIQKAMQKAFDDGKRNNIFDEATLKELMENIPDQSTFIKIDDLVSRKIKGEEREERIASLEELIGDRALIRSVKVGTNLETKKTEAVLRNVDGTLMAEDDSPRTGETGEVVINFAPYQYKSRTGLSRYLQGFKRDSEVTQSGSIWI
mgnify:CR=1 FL=1